ncbi:fragment of Putative Integrase (part 1) [Vibrio nigripulchritudo MADA3020]|nr:fragment of Putative Integrase (part 1) [Vibrio nigripulchritudo MADA3020]
MLNQYGYNTYQGVGQMASFSIKKRTLKSGETRFTVDIIVKNNSAIITENQKHSGRKN